MIFFSWALFGWPGILLLLSAVAAYVMSSSPYAGLNVLRKIRLIFIGLLHMLLSRDRQWKVFNRGFNLSFFIRLVRAIAAELALLPTRDSVFFDSPLSEAGLKQTQELIRFLSKPNPVPNASVDEVVSILRGEDQNRRGLSILTTSNLRRSIATCLICLWERLHRTNERIHVLNCLQEITFNIDGISLLEEKEVPDGGLSDALQGGEATECFNVTCNKGTKSLGREFFRTFLPKDIDHIAKKKKMVNCGVVAFDLVKGIDYSAVGNGKKIMYKIVPDSIANVYGGFSK